MNKMVNRKSVLKNSNSGPTEKRQKKKEKCTCSPITRKGKSVRKSVAKVKKVVRNANFLNEWAENESKPEIYEAPKVLQPVSSDDSVIYMGNYSRSPLHTTTPVIDLTQSASDVHENVNVVRSKSLKTIYFPSRNFDRNIKLRKSMATTSLITLPVVQKQQLPRKLNSTTILSCTDQKKLDVLDIPQEYLNFPDVSVDSNSFYEKTMLTQTDHKMIDWILDVEEDIEESLSQCPSECNSSLDTDMSRERISSVYSADSNDTVNETG